MGGIKFQQTHLDMVRLGLLLVEDNILYNRINIDSMHESSKGIPFKGHEIHVSIVGALIQTCSFKGSLVVDMNSSTSNLSNSLLNLVFDSIFSAISHYHGYQLSSQGIVFAHVSFLVIMFLFLN